MIKATYIYSFNEWSGKPKRLLESISDCTIKGYGVSTDTVTLCVLYNTEVGFQELTKILNNKFKLNPNNIQRY